MKAKGIRRNKTLNDDSGLPPLSAAALDWWEGSPELGNFGAIVGSDVLYDYAAVIPLLSVLETQHLAIGSLSLSLYLSVPLSIYPSPC